MYFSNLKLIADMKLKIAPPKPFISVLLHMYTTHVQYAACALFSSWQGLDKGGLRRYQW